MKEYHGIIFMALALAGCVPPGARIVLPPSSNISPGGLYSSPQSDQSNGPVSLRTVCNITPSIIQLSGVKRAGHFEEYDLLSSLTASGSVTGINASVLSGELNGNLSDYYDIKLKNGDIYEVSGESADMVFDRLTMGNRCRARYQRDGKRLYIYQVSKAYVGNVELSTKNNIFLSAEMFAKIKALEPKAKLQFERKYNIVFSGKNLTGLVELERR